MLKLDSEEKILIALHHHWISIIWPLSLAALTLFAPLPAIPFLAASERAGTLMPLFLFGYSLWALGVLLFGFVSWVDYYLDALVVTNKRVMNINQIGVFRYEVSEFKLERVQNITVQVPGFMASLLGYGDIKIETAGEISFEIKNVPRIAQAKDIILKYSKGIEM